MWIIRENVGVRVDYYFSVDKDREVEIKIKRSTFIGTLRCVVTVEEAKAFISGISVQHKKANHNCWAYVVGDKGQIFHSSDAGEPSGTAGKPMLNMLKKHKMTNIAAVVTRYFGGVKLGVRGLIEAYGEIVEAAIIESPLKKLVTYASYHLSCGYDFAETLKHRAAAMNAEILDSQYAADVKMTLRIEDHKKADLELFINEMNRTGKVQLDKSQD